MKRVSVVMPVHNAERYVAAAIDSALAEQAPGIEVEVICVDDGSTDGSRAVLESYDAAIKLIIRPENGGIGAARNDGIRAATGEYIAFLDADDYWKPGKLAAQLALLDLHPDSDLAFTRFECFVSPELPEAVRQLRSCPQGVQSGELAGTFLGRADAFGQTGLFDETLRVGEFIDWLARARDRGFRSAMTDASFLMRRIHDANTGVQARDARIDYVRVAREALRRRRGAA